MRYLRLLLRDYATLLVLLLLCAVLSVVTIREQHPTGRAGGRRLAGQITGQAGDGSRVLIVVRKTAEDAEFAAALEQSLTQGGMKVVQSVRGEPADARRALQTLAAGTQSLDFIAGTSETVRWRVFEGLSERYPRLATARVVSPAGYYWPSFLKTDNLLNVADQIAVIAIVAIGMTMVIVAGGIDLSVGSLIALTAVVAARLIRDLGGAESASALEMVLCCTAAIIVSAAIGAFTGLLVTQFRIPPFIVTLGVMSMSSGLAYIIAQGPKGFAIDDVPKSIDWLGSGADLFHIPNAVVLMLILYGLADVIMKRTTFGRYLYAVGGNRKAAFLCGVPVKRIVLSTYVISAALAGLGGVMQLSLFRSAKPDYGTDYELQVIAAVVVGGTSLAGGQGRLFGTLLGALIIAVVKNGMNLYGVSGPWQNVVLGAVILVAALLDRLKQQPGDEA